MKLVRNSLIRDGIAQHLNKENYDLELESISDDDTFNAVLQESVISQLEYLKFCETTTDTLNVLSDVFTLLTFIAKQYNIEFDEIVKMVEDKYDKYGSYTNRLFLLNF